VLKWAGEERLVLIEHLAKGLAEREYLLTCGRIKQLDETIAHLEELYRKYIQDDEEDDDE
jgi:hypothetical protein